MIQFVENCESADVFPKFLNFRIPNNGCFEPTVVHNFQRKLLKEELLKAKKALAEHESKVYEKGNILKSVLLSKLLPSVLLFTRVNCIIHERMLKQRTLKNWKICQKKQGHPLFNLHDTVKLFELDIVPSKHVLDTLALGPKNPVLEKSDQKAMSAEMDLL